MANRKKSSIQLANDAQRRIPRDLETVHLESTNSWYSVGTMNINAAIAKKGLSGAFSGRSARAWGASLAAALVSVALLVLSYAFPLVSWLVWFAFVPYLLAARKAGRLRLYALTIMLVGGYFFYAFALNGILAVAKAYNVAIITLIVTVPLVELQLLFRRLESRAWGWLFFPAAVTALSFWFMTSMASWPVEGLRTVLIYPVSSPIFRLIYGKTLVYALLFLVAAANCAVAWAFSAVPGKRAASLAFSIAAVGATVSLSGGSLGDLPRTSPEAARMDAAALDRMEREIPAKYPDISAYVVVRGGRIVSERHYRGAPHALRAVNSCTKSVTGSLVGIARYQGYIKDVDQKALEFFPEYSPGDFDPRASGLTIDHLLTFTSGYLWNDNRQSPFIGIYNGNDWYRHFLSQPFAFDPGVHFNYNSNSSHLLSAIVTRATGTRRSEFQDRNLWGPLGITRHLWPADGRGATVGGWGLFLRTRDMAKLGTMWLNEGEWNGGRIVDAEWIREATRAHSAGGPPCGVSYGRQFWVLAECGYPSFTANGFGGQFIYVVPALDLVVAISSDSAIHQEKHRRIVAEYIVPAILDKPVKE